MVLHLELERSLVANSLTGGPSHRGLHDKLSKVVASVVCPEVEYHEVIGLSGRAPRALSRGLIADAPCVPVTTKVPRWSPHLSFLQHLHVRRQVSLDEEATGSSRGRRRQPPEGSRIPGLALGPSERPAPSEADRGEVRDLLAGGSGSCCGITRNTHSPRRTDSLPLSRKRSPKRRSNTETSKLGRFRGPAMSRISYGGWRESRLPSGDSRLG